MRRALQLAPILALASVGAGAEPLEPILSQGMPPPPTGCDRRQHAALGDGPIAIGLYEADFVTGRRACPRSEVALIGRGGAVIDTPRFYGALAVDAMLSVSYAVRPNLELFGTLEVLHWQFVQNATLKGTSLNLGQLTIGASRVAVRRDGLIVTPYARLMLPTSTGTGNARVVGGEAGLSLAARPDRRGRLELHLLAGADLSLGLSAGPAAPRAGVLAVAGLQVSPFTWLALALDLQAHFGHRDALDYLAPALAIRLRFLQEFGVELAAVLPLLGADRHDGVAALRLSYRY